MLEKIKAILTKLIKDCLTSAGGDYDPARVVGYGISLLGGLEFLVLTAYVTLKNHSFDGISFATGLSGVAAALAAAAAGVRIKHNTEVPPEPTATPPASQ